MAKEREFFRYLLELERATAIAVAIVERAISIERVNKKNIKHIIQKIKQRRIK